MLARKRGALRDKSRKMAKKAQAAALQTDVTNDEEWQKVLDRKGLVLVDIYSEWSGPCTGMVSVLKKIKMEMGGDDLSYAIARCDKITALNRFWGKSEPAWMFLRNGNAVNMMFGADCPKLQEMLISELKKFQNDEPPLFETPPEELNIVEIERNREIQKANAAKEAARKAEIEAKERKKYEAYMEHLIEKLGRETVIILFPWIFVDEEGNKRDKKHSPPYMELIEILKRNFSVEKEEMRQIEEEDFEVMEKETDFKLTEETKHMLMDGKCMCMHLKALELGQVNLERLLANSLYNDDDVPLFPDDIIEGCFVHRHLPYLRGARESESMKSLQLSMPDGHGPPHDRDDDGDGYETFTCLTTVWMPTNPRNKAVSFRHFFARYVERAYPYEDKDEEIPITLFKYDTTRKRELEIALEQYQREVVSFAVFERDVLPNPRPIAFNIKQFDEDVQVKTSYEVFVAVVRKVSQEAFLSFAGIGAYHISETPEKAIEEANQYFPSDAPPEEEPQEDDRDDSNADDDEEEGEEEEEEEEKVET